MLKQEQIDYVCDQQVPLGNVGETTAYEVSDAGVVYKSPSKISKGAALVEEPEPI